MSTTPTGPSDLVLRACRDLPKDGYGYVRDVEIAGKTGLDLHDVRDTLAVLNDEGLVTLVRLKDRYAAHLTPQGDLAIRQSRQFSDDEPGSHGKPKSINVVPKGLRSYDEHDADFFLELLPEPGRTDRLPESIRVWKDRIEETDPDRTFRVGVIYGPSGCGKSSLVKAGLLPRLADHVQTVFEEATPDDTEARLLRKLSKLCPELTKAQGLARSLEVLSRGQAIPSGQKVLIVLDQFEQWLNAKSGEKDTELVAALRHCDGGHVQGIVIVRGDFWSATTRFESQIGAVFRSDQNSYSVDLFYQDHAEKVLTAFGEAYGRVDVPPTPDQREFIKRAVTTLSIRGMTLPVRLALFSLVFQSREWATKTLEEIGGVAGLEVEFFNNIFNFEYADRRHRAHQKAAQSVLGALLPKDESGIKRPRRPHQELLEVSGYAEQPTKFEDLLRILDKELFLITPFDQEEGLDVEGSETTSPGGRYYQLTHDFLVPSLREWQSNKDQNASEIVNSIMRAATTEVPLLIKQLDGLRFWADPKLRGIAVDPNVDSKERLHASLALLPVDQEQVEFLYSRLLKAGPTELSVLRDALNPYREKLVERLWSILEQSHDRSQHLQAASALAYYCPASNRWQMVSGKVAQAMVTVNTIHLGFWLDALRPARDKLTPPLAMIFRDRERPATERNPAANLLDTYASGQPNVLADLLMDSDERHFDLWFEKLAEHQNVALPLFNDEIARSLPEAAEVEKEVLTRHQARAAVALIRLGRPEAVWPLMRHSPDPRLRSYIVNWLKPLGADPKALLARMDSLMSSKGTTPMDGRQAMDIILFHPETSERRALILALGGYELDRLSLSELEPLVAYLLDLYRTDPDAGIHGASEWTLRQWKQQEKLKAADVDLMTLRDRGDRRWYLNGQGQTFAVIDGPVEFQMGSPLTEPERDADETLHRVRIPRRFAIASKEVSVEQYQKFVVTNPTFRLDQNYLDKYSPDASGPMIAVSWYGAAAYCNWLSEQEGLPRDRWCYLPAEEMGFAQGMTIPADVLQRTGYRLPTEAEWEYACRSGSLTSRYYGLSADLLGTYARYLANSREHAWPGGSLQPNDLGLFDMLGNVYEWCQDKHGPYQAGDEKNDLINAQESVNENPRLLRGGSFDDQTSLVRSAYRYGDAPSYRSSNGGFRSSRTYQ